MCVLHAIAGHPNHLRFNSLQSLYQHGGRTNLRSEIDASDTDFWGSRSHLSSGYRELFPWG